MKDRANSLYHLGIRASLHHLDIRASWLITVQFVVVGQIFDRFDEESRKIGSCCVDWELSARSIFQVTARRPATIQIDFFRS
jgi:hypothetical protein